MNNENHLPIGTVVMLKDGTKRVMITGFCTISEEEKEKIYDYSGCPYPEGFTSPDNTLLFNHNQIEQIYHIGFSDEEEKTFKQNLGELMQTIRK